MRPLLALALIGSTLLAGCGQNAQGHTRPPYHQRYFAQLRYDARRICAASSASESAFGDNTALLNVWLRRVDRYITDQRALEQRRTIIAPNYQDMANVVCPHS